MTENERNDLNIRVNKALEKIRPYLEADGGGITLEEVTDDKVVKVKLHGACDGCPFSYQTLKAGVEQDLEELQADLIKMVRNQIGPIACYRETSIVARLPKTRSGKILRGTIRAISNGKEWRIPSTIDDPASLDEITESLKKMGYPKKKLTQSNE